MNLDWVQNPDGTPGRIWNAVAGSLGEDGKDEVTLHPDKLWDPEFWPEPSTVFVGDIFHESVPDEYIAKMFGVMYCQEHRFIILTQNPDRMRDWTKRAEAWNDFVTHNGAAPPAYGGTGIIVSRGAWPLPNVCMGVLFHGQKNADKRIVPLLQTRAAVRFAVYEPRRPADIRRYLEKSMTCPKHGRVHLKYWMTTKQCGLCLEESGRPDLATDLIRDTLPGLDWVVVVGEVGEKARPCHPDWVRNTRDGCIETKVPFFFGGWGEWLPCAAPRMDIKRYLILHADGAVIRGGWKEAMETRGDAWAMAKTGPKRAGDHIDDCQWKQVPAVLTGGPAKEAE